MVPSPLPARSADPHPGQNRDVAATGCPHRAHVVITILRPSVSRSCPRHPSVTRRRTTMPDYAARCRNGNARTSRRGLFGIHEDGIAIDSRLAHPTRPTAIVRNVANSLGAFRAISSRQRALMSPSFLFVDQD